MEILYATIVNNHKDFMENQKIFNERLNRLEEDNAQIRNDHSSIKEEIATIRKEMENSLHEEILKMKKLSCLIIKGVPETPDGIVLVSKLLQIILPDSHQHIVIPNRRVGEIAEGKMRPLRIQLNNHLQQKTALKNCKKLAGLEEFKGISVCPDLTKQQQRQRKIYDRRESPIGTRSKVNAKRKNNDPLAAASKQSKFQASQSPSSEGPMETSDPFN